MFDPNSFLMQETEGANSTESVPVPVGEWLMTAVECKPREWVAKNDPSKSGIAVDILFEVNDQTVLDLLERDVVKIKLGIMLDTTETGGLDMGKGKNVQLGRLRQALGLNDPSAKFSFGMIPGRQVKGLVKHRAGDNGQIFAEVDSVIAV